MMLLIASCVFYCYFIPAYLLILIFTIVVDYYAGILIEEGKSNKKLWLVCSIVANVGILAVFKYFNFFISNINEAFGANVPLLNIILPVGLSFHTFQAMSYTIEVYKGNFKAERNIGIYALYVLFYPQLVAGPIERPQNVLPQIRSQHKFSSENLLDGLRLMTWGFFKKLVIADKASQYVDIVYKNPHEYHALNVCLAIFLFSIQIYCDFSGYTDIARGAARTMGFRLMVNFERPLFSKSIREFWQRWHISLSSWFRDYVYIPLGGNRVKTPKMILNLAIVFGLSGLWHGAGWNFIIWGLMHAVFVIISLFLLRKNILVRNIFGLIITNFLVAYALVFFRNPSVQHAVDIICSSFKFSNGNVFSLGVNSNHNEASISSHNMAALLFFIAFMFFYEWRTDASLFKMKKYPFIDTLWFVGVISCIILFGVFTKETFIYFQF